MAIVIALGFISDFGSLATFAGFITAGIAVALQTIILSVAAYFFLIGRYGVKVGDRVSISGVTGEVIDIGLVRVYLMELTGAGADIHSTGRLVIFTNSALFQAAPLFMQIPGTDYLWHEVAIPLNSNGNDTYVEKQVLGTVTEIYKDYRSRLEQQHSAAERMIDLRLDVPTPSARLRFADTGAELVIRFPVETRRTAEIDEAMVKGIADTHPQGPELAVCNRWFPQGFARRRGCRALRAPAPCFQRLSVLA